MCVLELSKLLMYKFYYDYLKVKYGDKCKLIYTDTDSLLEVDCEDFYKDMEKDLHLYDTGDYPKNHPCYSGMNKKVKVQVQGRVQRKANRGGHLFTIQDVLHHKGGEEM